MSSFLIAFCKELNEGITFNPLKTSPEYTRAGVGMGNVYKGKISSSSTG